MNIDADTFRTVAAREHVELERRERAYRGNFHVPPLNVHDSTIILIDDGLATGASMRAAIQALRQRQPKRIVVAAPVGAPGTCESLHIIDDEVICLHMPEPFHAIGLWYEDFSQTTDQEVRTMLKNTSKIKDEIR